MNVSIPAEHRPVEQMLNAELLIIEQSAHVFLDMKEIPTHSVKSLDVNRIKNVLPTLHALEENAKTPVHLKIVVRMLAVLCEITGPCANVCLDTEAIHMNDADSMSASQTLNVPPPRLVGMKSVLTHVNVPSMPTALQGITEEYVHATQVTLVTPTELNALKYQR